MKQIILVDLFKDVCSNVSSHITPYLKNCNDKIQKVHYMYGSPVEIATRLTSKEEKFDKYPLIILFTDIVVNHNIGVGYWGEANLRMGICTSRGQNDYAEKRTEDAFKPILYPIYEELLHQIHIFRKGRWKPFETVSEHRISHSHADRYFWGGKHRR